MHAINKASTVYDAALFVYSVEFNNQRLLMALRAVKESIFSDATFP